MERNCIKTISYASTMDNLKYAMPCARLEFLLCCRNNEWILVHFMIRALGECQIYDQVSLENEGLHVCESLR